MCGSLLCDLEGSFFSYSERSMALCIDFHTHIFPDSLAHRTIPALEQKGNVQAASDGTLTGLLLSMDRAGVEASVVCSIATRPSQFEAIFAWSREIRSERIVPLPSVHPADPDWLNQLGRVASAGFVGVKLHPYYQEFTLDEERMLPLYAEAARLGLVIVMHTGFDIGYPPEPIASPARIARVVAAFPSLKFIATHCGAWKQWDEVEELLLGRPVYMDISFSFDFMGEERVRRFLTRHPAEYLLFGSDSPWADQAEAIAAVRRLGLAREREELILGGNARRLLGGVA